MVTAPGCLCAGSCRFFLNFFFSFSAFHTIFWHLQFLQLIVHQNILAIKHYSDVNLEVSPTSVWRKGQNKRAIEFLKWDSPKQTSCSQRRLLLIGSQLCFHGFQKKQQVKRRRNITRGSSFIVKGLELLNHSLGNRKEPRLSLDRFHKTEKSAPKITQTVSKDKEQQSELFQYLQHRGTDCCWFGLFCRTRCLIQ